GGGKRTPPSRIWGNGEHQAPPPPIASAGPLSPRGRLDRSVVANRADGALGGRPGRNDAGAPGPAVPTRSADRLARGVLQRQRNRRSRLRSRSGSSRRRL